MEIREWGLTELDDAALVDTVGGNAIPWSNLIKGSGLGWIATQVIQNWGDIKEGFKAGYSSTF